MNEELLINKKLSNGKKFQVYIPNIIDSNTAIILYDHGAGGYRNDYVQLNKHLSLVGSNAIVIEYERTNNIDGFEILKMVCDEYNVPIDNYHGVGFSFGLEPSMRTMANVIKSNPDMKSSSIMLLDGHWPGTSDIARNEEVLSTLGSNGTVIFAINPYGITCNDMYYEQWVKNYGINVVRIRDTEARYYYDGTHPGVNANYVNKNLLDFQSGNGIFPSDGYIVETYNGEKWIETNIGGMTIDEVYSFFGIGETYASKSYAEKIDELLVLADISIKELAGDKYYVRSDAKLLQDKLNDIIGKIRNSTVVQETPDFLNYIGSTTNVPKQIPSVVQEFFGISANLMFSLNNDCRKFAKVGLSLEQIDSDMERDANNL